MVSLNDDLYEVSLNVKRTQNAKPAFVQCTEQTVAASGVNSTKQRSIVYSKE